MPELVNELVNMLQHSTSSKRKFAAKKLRKIKSIGAGSPILASLQKEMKNSRTWETQYHMIMALSDCSYTEGLNYLYELANDQSNIPMVNIAVGDAITNLEYIKNGHLEKIEYWLAYNQNEYLEGAIRAIAINRRVLSNDTIIALLEYVKNSKNDGLIFWLAAACPGWPSDLTKFFLEFCLEKNFTDEITKAAEAALVKKYLKWRPL
jgi:hypothetical protein